VFSRSHWFSNVSISTAKGRHIKTDRVLSNSKLGLVNYINGKGVFVDNNDISLGNEDEIVSATSKVGFGDVNFVANTGVTDYNVSFLSLDPEVNIHQKWFTNTSASLQRGFEQSYITKEPLDAPEFFNPQSGQNYDRLVFKGYKDNQYPTRNFILMNDGNDGFVGINNFSRGDFLTPDTIFNIRSSGDAVARITSENDSNTKAGLQLLSKANCLSYGADIYYANEDKEFNIDLYHSDVSTKLLKTSVADGNEYLGLFNGDDANNSMLTMGNLQNNKVAVSMYEHSGFESPTESYGKFFVKKVNRDAQNSTLNYVDGDGNYFEISMRGIDIEAGSDAEISIFADSKKNTLAGLNSPKARSNITTAISNTTYGNGALSGLSTGDYNVVIGARAGQAATGSVNDNILIGYKAGNSNSLGDENLIIGNNINRPELTLNETSNILIDDVLEAHKDMSVSYGTCNKVYLKDSTLTLTHGKTGQTPQNNLDLAPYEGHLSYTPHATNPNKDFDVNVDSVNVATFKSGTGTPTFEAQGNAHVKEKLFIGDSSTPLTSTNFIDSIVINQQSISSLRTDLNVTEDRVSDINSDISALFVEGYTKNGAVPPEDANNPTTCTMTTRVKSGSSWTTSTDIVLTNRDKFLRISKNDYVVAVRINGEYRPLFVSYGS